MPNWTIEQYVNHLNQNRRASPGAQPEPAVRDEPLAAAPGAGSNPKSHRVRFTSYRRRLLDRTNLEGGIKYFEDCLIYAGLISGDTEAELTRTVAQVKVKSKADERTEIELFYE